MPKIKDKYRQQFDELEPGDKFEAHCDGKVYVKTEDQLGFCISDPKSTQFFFPLARVELLERAGSLSEQHEAA